MRGLNKNKAHIFGKIQHNTANNLAIKISVKITCGWANKLADLVRRVRQRYIQRERKRRSLGKGRVLTNLK